jgi:hypothetical protein
MRWEDDHEWWVPKDLEWDGCGYFMLPSQYSSAEAEESQENVTKLT